MIKKLKKEIIRGFGGYGWEIHYKDKNTNLWEGQRFWKNQHTSLFISRLKRNEYKGIMIQISL